MAAKRVLIVDDALELGRLLQAAIATLKADLQVSVVPSAEEAQLEASRNPPNLIITDVRLPGATGLDLTRRIRTHDKQVKIILITALLDPTLRQQAVEAGADYFFKKPISMPDFLNAVVKLLEVAPAPPPTAPPASPAWTPGTSQPGLDKSQVDRVIDGMATLRRSLAATTVALMDEQEHVLVQDGEPADLSLDPGLLQSLSAALISAEKVSHSLGNKSPDTAYAFKGRNVDLVVSPMGGAFAIIAVFKADRSAVRLAIAVDEVMAARRELERVLAEMGVKLRPLQPKHITEPLKPEKAKEIEPIFKPQSAPLTSHPAPTVLLDMDAQVENSSLETVDANLEALLNTTNSVKPEEANAYWDAALKDGKLTRLHQTDRLNYDQARRMGLAPETPNTPSKP